MKKQAILLFITLLLSPIVYSGEGNGKITIITAHISGPDTGVIMFNVENHTNPPLCSSQEWAFSIDTDIGKAMYSLLLTAAAQNKSIIVYGTNDCAAWGDRERPFFIATVFQ